LAIYRGAGGSGDAVNDAASEVLLALQAKDAAIAAQVAAEAAQAAAQTAETNAETAETNAETAETNAETAETNAETAQAAAASSASAASTSATNASNSASTATTQATNASNSATAASTSASNASTSASAASTSASNAATAQSAAESARDATLAAYDSFDDRYLGAKSSAPTLDNDGNALVGGALYFDTVSQGMKVYTGSAWVDAYVPGSTYLAKANNLSDLTNTGTARTNLGLAIGTNVQAYDAQLADVAGLTPTDNGVIVGNGTNFVVESSSTLRTSLGLAIGTDVQAYDADLATIAGLTPTNNYAIIGNGTSWTSSALPASGVTSVTGTSPISSSGGATPAISLAANYGDTLNPYASKTANFILAAPNGSAGVPTFRAVVSADIPTLNQNTTGTASNVTGTVAIANGGTGQTSAGAALTALGGINTGKAIAMSLVFG
jgi:hypothetical protein